MLRNPLLANLSNHEVYNAILEILDALKVGRKGYLNSFELDQLIFVKYVINQFTESKDFIIGQKRVESYKLIFNIMILDLYELTVSHRKNCSPDFDLYVKFNCLEMYLFSKLDYSIITKLINRGITVIENVYIGFDTEYKNIESKTNKLLSVQIKIFLVIVSNKIKFLKISRKQNKF